MLSKFLARTNTPLFNSARLFSQAKMAGGMAAAPAENDALELWETENRSGFLITLDDKPGQLAGVLNTMDKYGINLTQIQSKPPKTISGEHTMNIHLDFVGN